MSTSETALAGEEFAEVMLMLARLPLTGRERAEVIRRLLGESSAWSNPTEDWLTVTEAAKLHLGDVDGMTLDVARSAVSRACSAGQVECEGVSSRRRIEPNSLDVWRLSRRERNLDQQDKPRPTLRA